LTEHLEKMKALIEEIKNRDYAVVVHRHADPDAVASSVPFKKIGNPSFYAPGSLSLLGKRIAEYASLEFYESNPREEILIVLDTASKAQLPGVNIEGKKVFRIDHHKSGDIEPYLVDINATSTSEIIAYTFSEILGLEPIEATVLMSGIIYDSKMFKLASRRTFEVMAKLTAIGNLRKAFSLLEISNDDFSRRIARIKACERLAHRRVKDYIIVVTEIGAFESDIARTLVSVGADVAYVIREERNEIRVYARCSPRVLKLGFDVSALLKELAEEYGGSGGGHPGAGGCIIPKVVDFQQLTNKLLGRTSRRLVKLLDKSLRG